MNDKKITWQELFLQDFKNGDNVIIVTDDDRFDWGELRIDPEKIRLIQGINNRGKENGHEYSYYQLTFICHQGFPVKRLTGADGSQSVLKEDMTDIQEAVRDALDEVNSKKDSQRYATIQALENLDNFVRYILPDSGENISKRVEKLKPEKTYPTKFGFGDPYIIETAQIKLFNSGNGGAINTFSPFIETLTLVSTDGAKAQLWDLEAIFFME